MQIERILSDAGERAALLLITGRRRSSYQYPVFGVTFNQFGLRSIVYHEAVPGHHFQIALQMEDITLPRFRKYLVFGANSAHVEGWALYAERLAAESGWCEGDPVGLLGQFDGALLRARRLVVDTGIHAKHWTRQQANDYMGAMTSGSTAASRKHFLISAKLFHASDEFSASAAENLYFERSERDQHAVEWAGTS